jgi:hypothetical protein
MGLTLDSALFIFQRKVSKAFLRYLPKICVGILVYGAKMGILQT